ncbi:MAG: hypothetical protein QXO57_03450 [Candidatus Aenigmatarchaeota archaeon]
MKKGQKKFEIKLNILYLILPIAFYFIYLFNFHLIFYPLIVQKPFIFSLFILWMFTFFIVTKEKILHFKIRADLKEKILFYSIFISFILIYYFIFSLDIPIIVAQTPCVPGNVCWEGTCSLPSGLCGRSTRSVKVYDQNCECKIEGYQECWVDCPEGKVCKDNRCVAPGSCRSDSDCPPCGQTYTQCYGNYKCVGGLCSSTCNTEGQSCSDTSGSFCGGSNLECYTIRYGTCSDGTCGNYNSRSNIICRECGQNECCSGGYCQPCRQQTCRSDIECPSDTSCEDWYCDTSTATCKSRPKGCTPGSTESQSCSYCSGTNYCTGGTQTRTCGSDCTWGSWSSCTGGTCDRVPGQCGVTGGVGGGGGSDGICDSSTCSAWSNVGCGVFPCSNNQMKQTRSCSDPDCVTSRCVVDPSCTGAAFGFSISVSPNSGTVIQGQSTSATVTANLISGSAQSVSFSCLNLPSGASCSFSPTSCNPTCSSTLTISSSTSTPTGTYSITIRGTGGGLTRDSSYTLTVSPSTCGNNYCDSGETQDNCPSDCKTVVIISPAYTYPGQDVTLIVYFNDSRFDTSRSGYDAKVDLTIDGQVWSSTDCPINSKRWRQNMNCNMGMQGMQGTSDWCNCQGGNCDGMHSGRSFRIKTSMGYGYIETTCRIPSGLAIGTHILTAVPTIYSTPITLRAAEIQFAIGNVIFSVFNTINNFLLNIFRQVTGLFVLNV